MRGTQRRRRRKRGQAGGASVSAVRRILRRGPSLQDKIAAGASMFFFGTITFWEIGIFIGKTSIKGD